MTQTASIKDCLSEYSDEFIDSQVAYYRKHLLSGNYHDRSLIRGQFLKYEAEQNRRASQAAHQA